MGKRPAARQASPMWVDTADLPTNAGHPFFERLNRVLEEAGFDAFVEELCAAFYAARMGRPSLRPGRYFRLLLIGYFEGLSSERGIAWRVADSLSLRSFLDLDVTEAAPDHSTLSRTRRLIDVETHVSVFTWVLERLVDAGLVRGKTVGTRRLGAARRRGAGAGEDGRHRCDDAGSERGDAEHRAAGYGRILRGFRAEFGGGVGGGDTDAGGSGSFRPVPEEQEDVEQGVEIAAGPGREDREDEGRSDALGPQGGARGRHGHGSHRLGDGAGCIGRRYGDAAGDADHGGRAGGVGAAGRSGG